MGADETVFEPFRVMSTSKFRYVVMVDEAKKHYFPVIVSEFQQAIVISYLSKQIDSTQCGVYSEMMLSWKALGCGLKGICVDCDGQNTPVFSLLTLAIENEVGKYIAQTKMSVSSACVLSVVTGVPMLLSDDATKYVCMGAGDNPDPVAIHEKICREIAAVEAVSNFSNSVFDKWPPAGAASADV